MKNKKRKVIATEISIEEIIADDRNMNAGSIEGSEMLDRSFNRFGAGRSILLDADNKNMAGNKSLQAFAKAGGKKVIVVDTDRDTLVAVRRPDILLDSKEGREMALADNQAQAVGYVADEEMIEAIAEEYDFETEQWGIRQKEDGSPKKIREESLKPFVKTHVLLSFPPEAMLDIEPMLEAIRKVKGVEYEQGSN